VELALDFVVLALYDVTVMCDDSASMKVRRHPVVLMLLLWRTPGHYAGPISLSSRKLCPCPLQFAEKGTRIDDLKAIIERVTSVTTLFDRCAENSVISMCLRASNMCFIR
jgi:hypothetical protein